MIWYVRTVIIILNVQNTMSISFLLDSMLLESSLNSKLPFLSTKFVDIWCRYLSFVPQNYIFYHKSSLGLL